MKLLTRLAAAVLLLCILSCKKNSSLFEKTPQSGLPNFSNVQLDKIFKEKESELRNRGEIVSELNQYYQTVWEGGDLWGGILVAKGDDILFEKYRGYGQPNNQMPIDAKIPMHVASVSKTLTAMAVLKLVEAGKVGLHDPLTRFFPDFPYPGVTVFTLLSQRSGLPKYEYFIEKIHPQPQELTKKFITNQDILNMLIRYKPELARETDTGFMYCNTNFALLALIVEKITREKFPQAMKEMLFEPLAMMDTHVFEEKDTATAAKSFYARGPKVYPLDRLDLIYGDKNVYTTPRDLLNFSKALYSDEFLKPELMKQVFQPYSNEKPGINNYGLGFRMKIFDDGEKLTYHNGWWHGSNAVFTHLLKSKVTIIAIGNKYSRRVYSAMALSGMFENFPYETEKLRKEMGVADSTATDPANTDNYSE